MSKVTVVIASLGNVNLLETINVLNSGTLIPEEILICVPVNKEVEFEIPANSKLIYCEKRSQVAQRAEGFRLAKSDFVLQLDDDTHLAEACLEKLVERLIKSNNNSVVAPVILNSETKESIYKYDNLDTKFNKLRHFIANGRELYKPGTITKVGSCFGPKFSVESDSVIETEWVAGCCVLHRRENLVCDDYYPFTGKAYSEDLIASYLYKLKSVDFYICNNAFCFTPPAAAGESSFLELIKELRARHYYIILSNRHSIRFYIYAGFRCTFELIFNIPKRWLHRTRIGYAQ
ncbi:MAG: glycosyltransferase [Pseudomonadota bacterium]